MPLPPPPPPPPETVDVPCSSTSLLALLLLNRRKSSSSTSTSASSTTTSTSSFSSSTSSSSLDLRLPRKLRRCSFPLRRLPPSSSSANRIPRSSSALSEPPPSIHDLILPYDLVASASPPDALTHSSAHSAPPPKQRSNSDAALHRFYADAEARPRHLNRKRSPLSRTRDSSSSSGAAAAAAVISGVERLTKRPAITLSEMQRVAAKLKCGSAVERWEAAEEVRLMSMDDAIARITLAMLGVIPPLVAMLDADAGGDRQKTALLALLNLAVGNEMNKSEIVKANAIPKMVALLRSGAAELQEAAVLAFLSLSALEGNKAVIGASGAIAWLVRILSDGGGTERRSKDALRALYNLSISAANVAAIEEAGGVPLLLAMVEDVEMSEKSLATLGNLAATEAGRDAIVRHREIAFAVLVDALRWAEAPKCQERAAYVVMMIANHAKKAKREREAMEAAGAIEALLELALLGSAVAQKRAGRALESFRRSKKGWEVWGNGRKEEEEAAEGGGGAAEGGGGGAAWRRSLSERRVVESLVRQSLRRTMRRIVKRASEAERRSSDSLPYH